MLLALVPLRFLKVRDSIIFLWEVVSVAADRHRVVIPTLPDSISPQYASHDKALYETVINATALLVTSFDSPTPDVAT